MSLMKSEAVEDTIIDFLKQKLKPKRVRHVFSVRDTAIKLARQHEVDQQKIELAALLHDCAKWMSNDQLLLICRQHQIEIDSIENQVPSLLHAKVGAFLAQNEFGLTNSAILRAISFHTTGIPDMSDLDQLLFVADFCEPFRNYPAAHKVRKLAYNNLEKATFEVCRQKLDRQIANRQVIHPHTVSAFNQLLLRLQPSLVPN